VLKETMNCHINPRQIEQSRLPVMALSVASQTDAQSRNHDYLSEPPLANTCYTKPVVITARMCCLRADQSEALQIGAGVAARLVNRL
jgi:hypothetical protein